MCEGLSHRVILGAFLFVEWLRGLHLVISMISHLRPSVALTRYGPYGDQTGEGEGQQHLTDRTFSKARLPAGGLSFRETKGAWSPLASCSALLLYTKACIHFLLHLHLHAPCFLLFYNPQSNSLPKTPPLILSFPNTSFATCTRAHKPTSLANHVRAWV